MAILGRGRRMHGRYFQALVTPYDVLDRSFDIKKLTTGYDPDEVDDYLESVAASMAGLAPRLTALDIRQHEFSLSRKFNSYDYGEVDDFLELIAQTLEYLEAEYGNLPPDYPPSPDSPSGDSFPPPPPEFPPPDYPPPPPPPAQWSGLSE